MSWLRGGGEIKGPVSEIAIGFSKWLKVPSGLKVPYNRRRRVRRRKLRRLLRRMRRRRMLGEGDDSGNANEEDLSYDAFTEAEGLE